MDISIVIVNYNTPGLTQDCVASVVRYTSGLEYEIIVVDNGSTKGDISALPALFPGVRLLTSKTNLGFSGGNNLGIADAKGKYILLLNSDTYLKDNALLNVFTYAEQQKNLGALSLRLVYPDGRHQSVAQRFPSVKYTLIELLRLQKLMSKQKAGKVLLGAFFDHTDSVPADWIWGAFFFFPRALLQQLPGQKLDDTYFMYWEDVQWCQDIKKLGYNILFYAGAEVVHIHEGSKSDKSVQIQENEEKFYRRNYTSAYRYILKKLKALL
jgi:GT2 family glycosyltransferase